MVVIIIKYTVIDVHDSWFYIELFSILKERIRSGGDSNRLPTHCATVYSMGYQMDP